MAKASTKRYSRLIEKAKHAARFAYAPYSKIAVGAALYTKNRKIFTGANVENSSYGLTVCAERVAVAKAVSEGETRFKAIVLYSKEIEFITPCGACLQVLSEFSPDIMIFSLGARDRFRVARLSDLLSRPFHAHRR
jgi:cytidine deaminase